MGGPSITRQALAAQFNVNRDTVAACLQGKEFEALRTRLQEELRAAALDRLKAQVLTAADAWIASLDVAAQKGDHRSAKDLLLHTHVIAPVQKNDGEGITIFIGGAAEDVQIAVLSPPAKPGQGE